MSVIVSGNEVVLNGCVGASDPWGFEDGFSASDVIAALARVGHGNDIVIRINSGGGIATEGSAIHAAIARHAGKKTIVVEGIAASAASVIAMAGDEVVMSLGALMMIHDPSGWTVGTIVDHEQQIAALTALGDAMATIYAAKSGQDVATCRADMKAETWMTGEQAVAKGYANRASADKGDAGEPDVAGAVVEIIDPAPFDYAAYANAPASMVAMAKAKSWTRQPRNHAPAKPPEMAEQAAAATHGETRDMTEEELNRRLAEARAEGSAEAKREAAATAAAASATSLSRVDAAEIAKLCAAAKVPEMASALLAEGVSVDTAKGRIGQAGEIKELVALARKANPAIAEAKATEFIAAGMSVADARAALFDSLVAKSEATPPLATYHRAGAGSADNPGFIDGRQRSKANMEALVKKSLPPKKEG